MYLPERFAHNPYMWHARKKIVAHRKMEKATSAKWRELWQAAKACADEAWQETRPFD